MRAIILLLIAFVTTSCGLIPHRDFFGQMEEIQEPMFRPRETFSVVSGDTGDTMDSADDYMKRVPADDTRMRNLVRRRSLSEELRDLEDRQTEGAYNQYLENENRFASVSERIYFLKMKDAEDREKYLENKGYRARTALTRQNDVPFEHLSPGMSKGEILKRFGRPVSRDIAGNPTNENERWSYHTNGKMRYIYFESGRVDGWSSNNY